jgi:capsular exopolysaccharide synthesis family protein
MKHSSFQPSQPAPLQAEPHSGFQETQQFSRDQSIGDIIRQANNLSPEQIEQILAYQREKGVRFGEAAVALGLANSDDAELIVATRPFSEQAEAFRSIRSHLIMKMYSDEGPRHALAVVSPENGDGKTFFAANLAVAFSQLPGRTLLIDADMRSPRLHELFNMEYRGGGLSAVLSGRAATNVIQSVRDLNNLFILPVGGTPPNPLELLERPAFELLIRELRTKFDRIIVDTPAASSGADSAVVAAKCGASLLLARRNHSSVDAMQNLLATVSMGSTRIVGTILNEY